MRRCWLRGNLSRCLLNISRTSNEDSRVISLYLQYAACAHVTRVATRHLYELLRCLFAPRIHLQHSDTLYAANATRSQFSL